MSGKIKYIAAGAVLVVVLVIALFFALRTTPRDVAKDFLSRIGNGEVEESYRYLTPELRARQNLDVFEATVEDLNLINFASVKWDKVDDKVEGTALLSGMVQTKAGEQIPLTMTLTRVADGGWLVAQYGRPGAPVGPPPDALATPTNPPAP